MENLEYFQSLLNENNLRKSKMLAIRERATNDIAALEIDLTQPLSPHGKSVLMNRLTYLKEWLADTIYLDELERAELKYTEIINSKNIQNK